MFLSASVAVSFLGGSEGVTIQSIGGTVASWRPGFVFWGANTLQKLHLHIPIFVSTIVHLYISVCVYIYVCIYLIYFNHTEIVSQKGYKAIKVCWFDFLKTFSTSNQPPLVWFCCGSICVCVCVCVHMWVWAISAKKAYNYKTKVPYSKHPYSTANNTPRIQLSWNDQLGNPFSGCGGGSKTSVLAILVV